LPIAGCGIKQIKSIQNRYPTLTEENRQVILIPAADRKSANPARGVPIGFVLAILDQPAPNGLPKRASGPHSDKNPGVEIFRRKEYLECLAKL
jgi:hypothetical protein